MEPEANEKRSNVLHPPRPLSRVTLQPILYLADRMAAADNEVRPRETRMVDLLAEAALMTGFRHQDWYKQLNEEKALARIQTEQAKLGCLVVLTLLLKADGKRRPEESVYFTRIRTALGAPPITVPVELEAHKALALEYVRD